MSSSLRNSPTRKRSRQLRCPTCGLAKIIQTRELFTLRVAGRRYRIEDVPHEKCEACGERILGIDASRALDAIILHSKSRHAA